MILEAKILCQSPSNDAVDWNIVIQPSYFVVWVYLECTPVIIELNADYEHV